MTQDEFNTAPLPEGFQGWWNPSPFSARSKWHLIRSNGRSLCGNWTKRLGAVEIGKNDSPDNCALCKRKFKILLEKK